MVLGLTAGQLRLVCVQHVCHLQEGRLDGGFATAESLGFKPSRTLGRSGDRFPCELLGFPWCFWLFLCFVFLELGDRPSDLKVLTLFVLFLVFGTL